VLRVSEGLFRHAASTVDPALAYRPILAPACAVGGGACFCHLCVDVFQDVDAAQLRLVRILAASEDNLFVVGDDDQPSFAIRTYSPARVTGPLEGELARGAPVQSR
jgi:superfamily I DNA/RNA helicase